MDIARNLRQLTAARVEDLYNELTGYGFVRRYVEGKSVVDIRWEGAGHGALAEAAESVACLTNSPQEPAPTAYPARNVSYQAARLPELPYPESEFDAAVAFGVIERLESPEDLVKETKRVLKQDGLLVVSTPDKQAHSNERNHRNPAHRREMYVPEFRELLERHFRHVRLYRQGTVAGGLIFRSSDEVSGASVESTRVSPPSLSPGAEPPATHFVVAVCSDAELPGENVEQPYLLLDRDRRLLEEYGDRSEDVELLRDEIRRMQDAEVQDFREALHFRKSEIAYLRARVDRYETETKNLNFQIQRLEATNERLEAMNERLEATNEALKQRLRRIESSAIWKLSAPYRRLRAKVNALREPGNAEGSGTHQSD